ncbi:nitrate- and nitrite sensing domain-containing protein [Actinoplanes sp. NPDC051494]|uniref:sensor histidine kinase n=1 Tax=Actinoplanes sp. NPDC051494 TaxID=3363907 RepID=UPI00378EA451
MLFGRLRILGKLTLLVLVPLIGVVALAVPIVVNRAGVSVKAADTSDTVELATQVGTALQELQEERLLSVGYYFGLVQAPELAVQSAAAGDRIAAISRLDLPVPAELRRALNNLSRLSSTRANVVNRTIRPDQIVTEFTTLITPVINALGLTRNADLTTSTGRQIYALDQALRSDDLISQAAGYLTSAVVTKNAGLVGLFSQTLFQIQLIITDAEPFFTPAQYKLYLSAQSAFSARVGNQFFTQALTDPAGAVKLLNIKTLFPSLRSVIVLGGFVEKRVAADVDRAVTSSRNSALTTAFVVASGTLLLLVLVIGLSLLMARAVARPLRRLTASADRVARGAEDELERVADDDAESIRPLRLDPVDVAGRDEIGDLARAFDRVQTTAARLVERQVLGRRNVAQMFGHVGRRTQNLVGRQLALIDSLERRETDSDRLRELYRLDHMSSRLRRNASSLVVLSGGAGANDHMAPLGLSDVVRLALGEIEDYTRVDVEVPEEIVVVPAVLADLTLLLAELMENATAFSPPHTRVTVTAAELRGGVRLGVVDHGLGLPPERIAEENSRLTTRERLDLAPSEVLGLFVVGRLARRHGIEVSLTPTPEGGITAWVELRPEHLVPRQDPLAGRIGPIQATVPSQHSEFAPLIAGGSVRSVPGSAMPFDANMLSRATRTLEVARSWNAFAVPAATTIEAAPVYEAIPVAGRFPAIEQPVRPALEAPVVLAAPADVVQIPRQRSPLRRRVPGSQLPPETAPQQIAATPTADDAIAARDAFDAFEAGVSRARWDVVEQDLSAPPAAGHPPLLTRRVPGATLPLDQPRNPTPPAGPATPLDPDAARAAMELFEDGVNRALDETQPQPEGQPR